MKQQQFPVIEEEFINNGEFIAARVRREHFVKKFHTFEEKISSLVGCSPKNKNLLKKSVFSDFKKIFQSICDNENLVRHIEGEKILETLVVNECKKMRQFLSEENIFVNHLEERISLAIDNALPHLPSKDIAYFMRFMSFLAERERSKEIFMKGVEQIIENNDSTNVSIYDLSLMCKFVKYLNIKEQELLGKCLLTRIANDDDFNKLQELLESSEDEDAEFFLDRVYAYFKYKVPLVFSHSTSEVSQSSLSHEEGNHSDSSFNENSIDQRVEELGNVHAE